jgi:uncharacterized membrane protein YfcA
LHLSTLDYLAAGGAAAVAGAVNALAGGGTLVSFPTLVALGVPAVGANVTNTVALSPGYLSGTWAQRGDLRSQLAWARLMSLTAALGALCGSILLVVIPEKAFRVSVPYLILAACALLFFQDRLRSMMSLPEPSEEGGDVAPPWRPAIIPVILVAAAYGGFFGAGFGIILLAVLGVFSPEPLAKLNALKQALQFVVNVAAAVFFVFSGRVVWPLVPVMAAAAIVGGFAGGRLATVIDSVLLRRAVVVAGVGVAIALWVG